MFLELCVPLVPTIMRIIEIGAALGIMGIMGIMRFWGSPMARRAATRDPHPQPPQHGKHCMHMHHSRQMPPSILAPTPTKDSNGLMRIS